jgi:hypothetical protein
VAELVDALDSKSSSARSAGSIPARGTKPAQLRLASHPQFIQISNSRTQAVLKSSLRANRSREGATEDRLRGAMHLSAPGKMDRFVAQLLAMTISCHASQSGGATRPIQAEAMPKL